MFAHQGRADVSGRIYGEVAPHWVAWKGRLVEHARQLHVVPPVVWVAMLHCACRVHREIHQGLNPKEMGKVTNSEELLLERVLVLWQLDEDAALLHISDAVHHNVLRQVREVDVSPIQDFATILVVHMHCQPGEGDQGVNVDLDDKAVLGISGIQAELELG